MPDNYFKGKKITLMGLGLLGRGIGDAIFLAQHGAELCVTDMKTVEHLASSVEKLKSFPNVSFTLSEHKLTDFQNRDIVIRAANVPPDSTFLAEAKKYNTPIEQSVSLFVRLLHEYKKGLGKEKEKYLIGVTGSKGKTTTTHLIAEMLIRAFPHKRVRMGGNIQGVSTLSYLDDLQPDDIFVLELDSWQLQSFGDSKMSPHVSVFTTFMPDHMDYYLKATSDNAGSDTISASGGSRIIKQADLGVAKGDSAYGGDTLTAPEALEKAMDRYFNDKANIFCFQGEKDMCFIGTSVSPWVEKHHPHHAPRLKYGEKKMFPSHSLSLQGKHNEENITLAASAARELGVPENIIEDVVASFAGVAGRLQFVFEKEGVKYYNDTTATMPEATMAALRALSSKSETRNPKERNIILIMGGMDKQLPMGELMNELPQHCRALVLLKGVGTTRIRPLIHDEDFDSVTEVESMQEAVTTARRAARVGDTILLSPAFSSKGTFINEYDRGDQFMKAIQKI
ncbi:MAG: Mur ligase family protein [Candidatus Campbellbacteria bacterium]|nr:Mur ligase family protein [Candidatus Campbellbacteria bacterium]